MLWEACNKLRGGVEPARYKDYVLVLLFHKYVSDRYKGQPYAMYNITDETSFDALTKAKGKPDVGERVDKIIQKFMENNHLQGSLPEVSFNNTDELGSGNKFDIACEDTLISPQHWDDEPFEFFDVSGGGGECFRQRGDKRRNGLADTKRDG